MKQQPTNCKLQANSGFTLVEMVVSVFIISVIVTIIFSLQNFIITQQEFTIGSYLTVETANSAMQTLEKEIKNSRPGDNGAHLFELANDQELIFYSNADRDDDIEKIRYFLDGTSLKKTITNPTTYPITYPASNESTITLNEFIRNDTLPIFTYYNSDWPSDTTNNPLQQTSRLSQTRLIGIHLIVNSNANYQEANHELKSYVQIRTLKDNL